MQHYVPNGQQVTQLCNLIQPIESCDTWHGWPLATVFLLHFSKNVLALSCDLDGKPSLINRLSFQ